MEILLPGIISVFTVGTPMKDVFIAAGIDVGVLIGLVAAVAFLSFALGKLFVYILNGFTGKPSIAYVIESYLTYPGVLYHELSHALFGLLSGAKITHIALTHKRNPDGTITLGSVDFLVSTHPVISAFQVTLSGIAPSITGVLALVLISVFAFPNCQEWWQWLIWIYLFICVLLHSDMSKQDLHEVSEGLPIVLTILFVIFCIFPIDVMALLKIISGII